MFGILITYLVSAIVGGIIWDVFKFPINRLFYYWGHNDCDVSGYWINNDVTSQKPHSQLTATEIVKLTVAHDKVQGILYQLSSNKRFSTYKITVFIHQGMLSLSYGIERTCFEMRHQGIQTGTFNFHVSNDEDQHVGTLTGTYTEYYSAQHKNKSAKYTLVAIPHISLKRRFLLAVLPFSSKQKIFEQIILAINCDEV